MTNLDDGDNFVSFGTALEPIEEEEVARKKPITIADQIATDENGRRRFHGAFTGGFSAGYYNTVGSKEGWTPSTFKSSRSERFASSKSGQNVTDFMDDEDMGAFGIAPQVLRPTDEFSISEAQNLSRKRPKVKQSDGPIPGMPVLHQIIEPTKDTVGIKILIKMGWKPGQGVGPRVSRKKDKDNRRKKDRGDEIDKPTIVDDIAEIEKVANQRIYGCQLPAEFVKKSDEESSEDEIDTDVLYAPEDVESPLCNPKENSFGLGYKGLERMAGSTGHVDLFGKQLKFRDVPGGDKNKAANVTGEAFGIGAFEDADEDVYTREDMSSYDFELETTEERKLRKTREAIDKLKKKRHKDSCIDGFHFAKSATSKKKFFPPPTLPHNFEPVHRQRKSRFEQPPEKPEDNTTTKRGLGRHALSVQERQVLLGETPEARPSEQQSSRTEDAKPIKPSETDSEIQERVERIKKFVQVLQAHTVPTTPTTDPMVSKPVFQPFVKNPEKQERYDKYLTLVAAGFQDNLKDLQPPGMTEWEREREKQEFEKARDIYKPLSGVMSSRFVSAKSHDISHIVLEKETVIEKDPSEDPKVAAKLNLFGRLTHTVIEWHPDKVLCKRFNMKDPYPDSKFVGLRGVSLAKMSTTKTNMMSNPIVEKDVINTPSTSAPKKSLFDNLDFSKPPPEWLSAAGQDVEGMQSKVSLTVTEGEFKEASETTKTKSLEFQSSLGATDEKENVPTKAPLDLFKQIFADSSESEAEDEIIETTKTPRTPPKPKPPDSEDKSTSLEHKTKTVDDKDLKTKPTKSGQSERKILYEKRYSREEQSTRYGRDSDDTTKSNNIKNKGLFDNFDFAKLSHKQNDNKDNKETLKVKCITSKEASENVEEDQDLLYGPKAPIKPVVSNSNLTRPHSSITSTSQLSSFQRAPFLHVSNPSGGKVKLEKADEEVVWVEKEVVSHSKSKKHSTKKSKKSKDKKAKSKEKHGKKSKKHKSKKPKHKSSNGRVDSFDDDEDSDNSVSSIEIHGSLNQRALLAQLKQITHPH